VSFPPACRAFGGSTSEADQRDAVTDPLYNAHGEYTAAVSLFAFLIGINEGIILGGVIDAGVSTIFVGLGEDPMYV
jgi:hypothetical protein